MEAKEQQTTVPEGFWQNSKGHLVPESMVSDLDKLRDQTVRQLVEKAKVLEDELRRFKKQAFDDIAAMVETSAEQYGVSIGGQKGGVVLSTYDGRYRVQRSYQDRIGFDERIKAAKVLVDECLFAWGTDAPELRTIATRAFETTRSGDLRVSRILEMRSLKIDEPKWQQAMAIVDDALTVSGTAGYIRVYQRIGESDQWQAINLDLAGV